MTAAEGVCQNYFADWTFNVDNGMTDDEFLDDGFFFRLTSCFDKGEACSLANLGEESRAHE